MEVKSAPVPPMGFSSPEAEFAHLDKQYQMREQDLQREGAQAPRIQAAHDVLNAHRSTVPSHIVEEAQHSTEALTLPLSPEIHDEKMGELIHILLEKGVHPAMARAEASGSPHIIDDFHRILVAYLSQGYGAKGLARGSALSRSLSMVLFEIALPDLRGDDEKQASQRGFKELLASMEQFYQGMMALPRVSNMPHHFTFEIANPVGSPSVIVYAAVPKIAAELFEKLLTASLPNARITWRPDDYNIFAENGVTLGSIAEFKERGIYPLKTYEEFDHDPLNAILTAFSKLDVRQEGAAIQFVFTPDDHGISARYHHALEQIRNGTSIKRATDIPDSLLGRIGNEFWYYFFPPKKKASDQAPMQENPAIKSIEQKIARPLMRVNIRAVASGVTADHANAILLSLEAAFKQFTNTTGNELKFKSVPRSKIIDFSRSLSFRLFDESHALTLSTAEITTLAHLPVRETKASPELSVAKANEAPAPADIPREGSVIGVNRFRGNEREIRILPEDRLRHLYVIGQTGTGKSTMLKNIIIQDIKAGNGVCMIDPHGSDVLEVLSAVPPERIEDVIYFDPGAMERPMGLNMLEYDARYPEQKSLVVDELLGIFKKLFDAETMGPAFDQYFRNASLLVMDDPSTGSTLLDIGRVFSDPAFRTMKLERCKNPIVVSFWKGIALQAQGEQGVENYGPYVTSKIDGFVSNEIMRPIIAQQESSFDFRSIMDNKKILLVNLSKGRIGDLNANLLGLIIVGKFLIAALSRADSIGKVLPTFYLHIDEFQNFTTPSIATILSEARKYKLSLTVAHQFIAQLTEPIRDAVFGNVGSICSFRVGADDAALLVKQFEPVFTAPDLMNIDNQNAYVRLLINGRPEKPFNIATLPFKPGTIQTIDRIKELSYLKYGRERSTVEAAIAKRYR